MSGLWYGSDEVNDFHPVVEDCLKEALRRAGLEHHYKIEHHFQGLVSGIPDFILLDKTTEDIVCIIEVKKTPSDVFSNESGEQCRDYAQELYPLRWKAGYHPYFCVTNIEITQLYALRNSSPLIGCLLTGSPREVGSLERLGDCKENFIQLFTSFFGSVAKRTVPEFSMYLQAISESFGKSFYTIAKILGVNLVRMGRLAGGNEEIKRSILYELLRFAFYFYIKETYAIQRSKFSKYFKDFDVKGLSELELVNLIEDNFATAMKIDFSDILKNSQSPQALIPEKLPRSRELSTVFNHFIQILRDNAPGGVKKNQNLRYFVSLLTSEIYPKDEMSTTRKIMSDEVLSNVLAKLAITSDSDNVVDPCCGDGNLLISAYGRLQNLKHNSHKKFSHNEILAQLNGIEIDPNLVQLTAFKLICNDLHNIDKNTKTNLSNTDLFTTELKNKYDALVMNPPFLRNEDVEEEIKKRYLQNIEKNTGRPSFIRNVRQPNLYFYFVEKAVSMLRPGGRASIILMTKFLNNEDGRYLKEFMLPYLNAVISYPPDFFKGFAVTTCIVLLSKDSPSKDVSFLNVLDTGMLADPDKVLDLINGTATTNDKYSLVKIDRNKLIPSDNWRLLLVDPEKKIASFESLGILRPLNEYFKTIKRGGSDNCGGSKVIYPSSAGNQLSEAAKKIESNFLGNGLQRNKLNGGRRNFILTRNCLNAQIGLMLPGKYDGSRGCGLTAKFMEYNGLKEYCTKASKLVKNWKRIYNSAFKSKIRAKIILPRADREKHSIYYNPFPNEEILLSTNFFYLDGFRNNNQNVEPEQQVKFIAAFLLSSFGQIQFEINANNQEGMRKIEGFAIEKLKVPDLGAVSAVELSKVVREFENLNKSNVDFTGLETDGNPRNKLDMAIGEIIFRQTSMDFPDASSMVKYFQQFLYDLVKERMNK